MSYYRRGHKGPRAKWTAPHGVAQKSVSSSTNTNVTIDYDYDIDQFSKEELEKLTTGALVRTRDVYYLLRTKHGMLVLSSFKSGVHEFLQSVPKGTPMIYLGLVERKVLKTMHNTQLVKQTYHSFLYESFRVIPDCCEFEFVNDTVQTTDQTE
jgi:hypothetical protein